LNQNTVQDKDLTSFLKQICRLLYWVFMSTKDASEAVIPQFKSEKRLTVQKPSLANPSIEKRNYHSPKFRNDSQQLKKDSTTDNESEHH